MWVWTCPSRLTRARLWQSFTSAHRKPGRGFPKNFKGEYLKLGLKFHIGAPITLGVVGVTSRNFIRGPWFEAGVIKWTLILHDLPPTKFGRAKNVQNSARFLTTFDFNPEYLRDGSMYRKSEKYLINCISSPIGRKIGELWTFLEY